MPAQPPSPTRVLGLVQQVLLEHLGHGDADRALTSLSDAISGAAGVAVEWVSYDVLGHVRRRDHRAAAARHDVTVAAPPGRIDAQRLPGDGQAWHRFQVTGPTRDLGALSLRLGLGTVDHAAWAAALAPALDAAAALLARDAEGGPACRRVDPVAPIRAALLGAGTFVWEWNIDTDWLGDIDEGYRLLGYQQGEFQHTQAAWTELIHPDDRAPNHDAYLRHARGEVDLYEHRYRILARDGSWRWFEERGRIVEWHPDGRPHRMVGTQSDLTERQAMEAAASSATARLSSLARHVPGILYQVETRPDGSVWFPYVSEGSQALFGVAAHALAADAAMFLRMVEPRDRRALLQSVRQSWRAMTPWSHDFRMRRRDGEVAWMRGASTPQRDASGSVVWHGYLQDVTELRALEQAQQARLAAEAASRAKTEFLSRMSHELRTPLNAVLGFAQLLEIDGAPALSDTQRRRVRLIREAGDHLLLMIGDLLDLTRIEAGNMSLRLEAVPVGPLVEECRELVRSMADGARVLLGTGDTLQDGHAVRADRTRLKQVMLNLLSNAIKYNRPGGRIDVSTEATGQDVVVRVSDSGIGIAPSDLPRLFEPFHRGPHGHGPIEGTGIGLAVSRSLVVAMGGGISAHSKPGLGSTFSVRLPRA